MSSDFKTVLVKDATIADITPDLIYSVKSGANSTTYQHFTATSSGNSVQVYNIQVPSENIIVARDALISTPLQFRVNISNVPIGQTALAWGQTASLQAFPLASIMNTASATINNSTTSINLQDVLPQILRLNNNRELFRHNGMCPSLPDQEFGVYSDATGANSSPLAGAANKSYDGDLTPRGAHPCIVQIDHYTVAAGGYVDHSPVSTAATDTWIVTVFTVSTEPIFLSPFLYGNSDHNQQGMLGINNMSFTFNINAELNRLVSYAGVGDISLTAGVGLDPDGGKWVANGSLFGRSYELATTMLNPPSGGPSILLRLLSSQPSDKLQTRNVVPYFDLPRYLTSVNAGVAIAANSVTPVSSQAIQLNQLPDYFIIVARKSMSMQTAKDSSSFLTIRNISINLNNQSGLLSSASANDLWRLSTKNQSQQSWAEFSGKATVYTANGASKLVPTTGSMLVISPIDLSLPDNLSCGSLGAFSLQFRCDVFNQFDVAVPNVELCVIACNSGIMVLSQGTTNIYTGMLTREAVGMAKDQKPVVMPDRMVGGFLARGLAMHPRRFGHMSGAAMSAGAMSAGSAAKSRLAGMY
jgi:hypothetical protein